MSGRLLKQDTCLTFGLALRWWKLSIWRYRQNNHLIAIRRKRGKRADSPCEHLGRRQKHPRRNRSCYRVHCKQDEGRRAMSCTNMSIWRRSSCRPIRNEHNDNRFSMMLPWFLLETLAYAQHRRYDTNCAPIIYRSLLLSAHPA